MPLTMRNQRIQRAGRGQGAFKGLETLERRQLMAADLLIESTRVVSGPTNPAMAATDVRVELKVANRGNATAFNVQIARVMSDDGLVRGQDELLDISNLGTIAPNQVVTVFAQYDLFYSEFRDGDDNQGFMAYIVDPFARIIENDKGNNSGRGAGLDSFAYRAEGDLVVNPSTGVLPNATAVPANGVVNGVIGDELVGGKDVDVFSIDTVPNRFYEVDVDTLSPSTLDAHVRVYDRNFNLVASNDDGGYAPRTVDPYVQFASSTTGGRYYVVVAGKQNANAEPRLLTGRANGSTGAYRMVVVPAQIPTVKVRTGATAVEGDATRPATITVSRENGSTDRDLFVKWELFGSATTADLNLPTDGVTIPAGQASVTLTVVPAADGISEPLESLSINLLQDQRYVRDPVQSFAVQFIQDDPRTDLPDVTNAFFAFNNFNGTFFQFEFDQNVSGFDAADVQIRNLTTGAVITGFNAVQPTGNTARVNFQGFANNTLPDGNYSIRLNANAVGTVNGVRNVEQTFAFFALGGDANRDRRVDIQDFSILAGRFNQNGNFINGDFNYNGRVDIGDFGILAANFNKSLPAAGDAPTASVMGRSPFGTNAIERGSVLEDIVV
jgi:hypothetical protein